MEEFKPKHDQDYKDALHTWLMNFVDQYLNLNDFSSEFQKNIFLLTWDQTIDRLLNPDISGDMTRTIEKATPYILKCKCCIKVKPKGDEQPKVLNQDGSNFDEIISGNLENMTILMEMFKYYGRDLNIVSIYQDFSKISKKIIDQETKRQKYTNVDIQTMFKVALQNLKFMGYVSATKQNAFLFRKNLFGKPERFVENDHIENSKKDKAKAMRLGGGYETAGSIGASLQMKSNLCTQP